MAFPGSIPNDCRLSATGSASYRSGATIVVPTKWSMSVALLLAGFCSGVAASDLDTSIRPLDNLVQLLVAEDEAFDTIQFADVVRATTGNEVIPVDPDLDADRNMLRTLGPIVDEILVALNAPDHEVHQVKRINEVSRFFEDALRDAIDRVDTLTCVVPVNASGSVQRSGYPDLRIQHLETGRVYYLDPKLYRSSSESSSFRTFYFEPKVETNKITESASHLVLGIAHDGRASDGSWTFSSWKLIDLAEFQVKLKAEFQASNRELYRDDAVLIQSSK